MTVFTILSDTSTPGNFDGTTLPKLLFGDTTVTFVGHHVIPQDLFNVAGGLFEALTNQGLFDTKSFAQNGLPLPGTPQVSRLGRTKSEALVGCGQALAQTQHSLGENNSLPD